MIYRLFVLFCLLALGTAMWGMVPMERARNHKRWIQNKRADGSELHEVVFAIKQRNLDLLDTILMEVSDPTNPRYGQHLTFEQVGMLTTNTQATEQIVAWLNEHHVTVVHTTKRGEYIKARAPVGTWEQLLGTEFYQYQHPKLGSVVRSEIYNLPASKEELLSAVFNTVQFPEEVAPKIVTSSPSLRAAGTTTPDLLNSFYHITSNNGNGKGSQSLYASLDQYYSPADLATFQNKFNLPHDEVDTVIGGHEDDGKCRNPNNCAEANLDVQYMMGVSQNVPTTYWYADTFLGWIHTVADTTNPPLVHSISYGSIEDSYPTSLANAFNTEAKKLGVIGVTILVASGDDGVANFGAREDESGCGYHPSFPASSPYVTAVGATQGPEDGKAEIACQSQEGGLITTGGGFSTIFEAPAWQQSTIKGYFNGLSRNQTPVTGYATSGRGYPDVSALGRNYVVVIGGRSNVLSGTSASSPVIGGMVALVNAQRIAAGKSSLGFLNPALYQNGGIFNDITSGFNNCAASADVCCDEGFYATSGWDPVTGLGSVDFAKFSTVFSKL